MENLRNRIHIKPVKCADTETMHKKQKTSKLTGVIPQDTFGSLAFSN